MADDSPAEREDAVSELDKLASDGEQYAKDHPEQVKEGEDAVEKKLGLDQPGQARPGQGQPGQGTGPARCRRPGRAGHGARQPLTAGGTMIGQEKIIEGAPWMQSADGVAVWQLACPECAETEIEQPEDTGAPGVATHPAKDGGSPVGTDGGYTEFQFRCRACHQFRLIVAPHKGTQFIGVVQAGAPAANSDVDVPGTLEPS